MNQNIIDALFIYCLFYVWLLLLYHIILCFKGYQYYLEVSRQAGELLPDSEWPMVSILIPAHNEESVIQRTVQAIGNLDYPLEKFRIIVINDCSTDHTGEIIERLKLQVSNLEVITTYPPRGGHGKSGALNIGLQYAKGELVAVYDADNTPERMALRYLVSAISKDDKLGAVIGKFRIRNKNVNILTRFINIETLSFQWMSQAGRWKLFALATIPGTNFVIRKDLVTRLGGWDEQALAEDTELSVRIYQNGYRIKFFPLAVTWEQEPATWSVWMKQRTRWVRGNVYVVMKYFPKLFHPKTGAIFLDIFYFFATYFLFVSSVIISDIIFLLGLLGIARISLQGPLSVMWLFAYLLFILEVSIALTMEKGENSFSNILVVALMYFTYCQAWLFLVLRSFGVMLKEKWTGVKATWYTI